jgi:hypothetical protein
LSVVNQQNPSSRRIKGTVARDFWPLVFFINWPHMGPWFTLLNIFEFGFEFSEIFLFEGKNSWISCRIQRWFRIRAVGYSANSESALSDTALSPNQRCIRQRWLLQRRNY